VPESGKTLQEIRISNTDKGERAYLRWSSTRTKLDEKELYNRDIGDRNRDIRITRSALPVTRTFTNSIIAGAVTLSLKSGGYYIKSDELWNSIEHLR
jgi:hypothetical protein